MRSWSSEIARAMVQLGAVSINIENRFEFASGLQSPIYFDGRQAISDLKTRELVLDGALAYLRDSAPELELVAGVATAGIPWSAWIADRLSLPLVYVRSKPKGRGLHRMVEGILREGKNTLVVEDLVTTGTSSAAAVNSLRESGLAIHGVLSIFSYELPYAKQLFRDADISHHSLSSLTALLQSCTDQFSARELAELVKWRDAELPLFAPDRA